MVAFGASAAGVVLRCNSCNKFVCNCARYSADTGVAVTAATRVCLFRCALCLRLLLVPVLALLAVSVLVFVVERGSDEDDNNKLVYEEVPDTIDGLCDIWILGDDSGSFITTF